MTHRVQMFAPLFGALAIAAIAAPAAVEAAPSRTSFAVADRDGDGFVSEREFYATQDLELHQFFFRADRGNDRRLDRDEFARLSQLVQRRKFSAR